MSEHISEQDGERYRKRVMTSDELFATSFHLAVCDACHDRFAGQDVLEPTYTFIRDQLKAAQDEESDHIGYEQIAAYVDQKLSWPDREVVETHFEICSQCTSMADKRRLNAPLSSPATPVSGKPSSRASIGRMTVAPWRVPAAALAGALLVWLVLLPLRSQVGGLQAEVEQLRRTNETLSQEVSALGKLQAQRDQYQRESERLRQENEASQAVIGRLERELAQKQVRSPGPVFSSQPVVALTDESGPVVLDEQGNITGINSLPLSYQRLIKTALTTGRLKTPPLIGKLIGRSSKTMGNAGSSIPFALLAPAGTVIESDRPTFRWQPLAEASGYTVTLLDSGQNKVATSPMLSTNDWQMTARLKRGQIYYWQVKALQNGKEVVSHSGPAPDVRFKILEQAKVDELERARKLCSGSHVALGVIYAQMGLVDEAEKEIEKLARFNPSSAVVQRLLRSLQTLKR